MWLDDQDSALPRLLRIAAVSNAVLVAMLAAAGRVPSAGTGNPIGDWLGDMARGLSWWAVPIMSLLTPIIEWLRGTVGPPGNTKAVHDALDVFRRSVFGPGADARDRVTLFRYRRFKLTRNAPFILRRCLVAVERSGHMTRDSRSVFVVGDVPEKAEGVAGQAYARNSMVNAADLPDASCGLSRKVKAYAKLTFVSRGRVAKKKPYSRSICGVPLVVRGRCWGTIVVDSARPTDLSQHVDEHFATFSSIIASLL